MIDITYENALFEVYEILKYLNTESKEKIPRRIVDYINENKSTNYNFEIDKNKPIYEQELLPETEAFITLIYRDYICSESEKKEINRIIKENDLKYEEELNKEYNIDNIFKDAPEIETSTVNNNSNLPIEINKDNIWKRILKRIKSIFNIQN